MANSLYKSTAQSRKIVLIALAVIAVILLFDNLKGIFSTNQIAGPTRQNRFYMEVDRIFDDVPVPTIPKLSFKGAPSFTIESVHGLYPDIAYVYSVDQPRETLLSFERAQSIVAQFGFEVSKSTNQGDVYKWTKDKNTKTITYDRQKQVWSLTTDYSLNEDAVKDKTLLPEPKDYASRAESTLSRVGFSPIGLDDALIDVKYVSLGVNETIVDQSQTNQVSYAAINIFKNLPFADLKPAAQRPQLEKGEIVPEEKSAFVYSDDPRFGQFSIIASNQLRDASKDIFKFNYTDFEYGAKKGSYLIVSPDEAWNNIARGGGSLVFMQPQNANYFGDHKDLEVRRFVADARETKIAYYEPKEWSGYVYPIYTFTGRAELSDGRVARFIYFVDAIKRTT